MAKMPKPEEMIASRASFPEKSWMDVKTEIKAGMYAYPAKVDIMEGLHMPHPHAWQPEEEDWHLPENWEEIIYKALKERLAKHRSLKIFMDTCVRCGACADKCHFFLGTNDPKNMPVLRAELLRSVYRRDFTTAGRLLGKVAGARKLTTDVIKEWFTYFYQCTECRRCSLFCPYGIDTAEITAIVRELLHELGLGINWIMEPVSNCNRTGNHLGIQPHAFKEIVEFLCEDIETITGIHIDPPFNEKGHEILFITPSGDVFAEPGIYTFMGYLMLFHELGLDYTLSTYASEGGNFGSFVSFDMAKKLNAKMYAEAKRLGSKWILGGECGHMWRVINQYMATYNGPAPEGMMDVPTSPITGTRFENARATKMVHIAEFTADLIHHNKLNLRPERNTGIITTFHDSCNPARAMGMLEEPRAVLRAVCPEFVEMPPPHHPGRNLLLRFRFRPQHRGNHGTAPARRLPPRERPPLRAGKERRQLDVLRLRHRPRHAAASRQLLGAGRHRQRPARTGRQRAGHEGRTAPYHEPASGRPRMPRPRARGRGR